MPITQAIIAAAGLSTRLRPLTDTIPKPMLPVLDKPLLEWHVEQFKKHGVREFFFTLHYLPDVIRNYFGDGSTRGIHINYIVEPAPLGSASGLKLLEKKLPDRFYYIYGDVFSLMDYTAMADAYATKDKPLGMQRTKRSDDYADADVAELDEDDKFIAVHAKPHPEKYVDAHRMRGVFIFEKEICAYIPVGVYSDLATQVLPRVLAVGRNFYGYECEDYSKGIDTIEKLHEVEGYLRAHGIKQWW